MNTNSVPALRGFNGLRTPNAPHLAPVESIPKRTCKCGTVLPKSNRGDTCCQCFGTFPIPDWMVALVDLDPGDARKVNQLAALLTERPSEYIPYTKVDPGDVLQQRSEGASVFAIAESLDCHPSTVKRILIDAFGRVAREGDTGTGKRTPEHVKDAIAELIIAGRFRHEIARELHVSGATVDRVAHNRGLVLGDGRRPGRRDTAATCGT